MHKLSKLLLHHSIQACSTNQNTVENKYLKFSLLNTSIFCVGEKSSTSNEGGLCRTFKALFVTVSKALHAGFLCLL